MRRARHGAHADSGPFAVHFPWLAEFWYGQRRRRRKSRCLATLRRRNVFPSAIWQLKVTTNPARGSHYAVHLSLRGRLTRLQKFVQLEFQLLPLRHKFPSSKDAVVPKKACGMVGRTSNVVLVSARARGLPCAFVTLIILLSETHKQITWCEARVSIPRQIIC